MNDSFWHIASYGKGNRIVRIGPSRGGWGLWLDEALIADGFSTPEDAAFSANKRDFPTQRAKDMFTVWVPSELNQWRQDPPSCSGQPELPAEESPVFCDPRHGDCSGRTDYTNN